MSVRILIVDDFAIVRQGLRMYLALDPDLEVVGEAENGAEGLLLARELRPDVVLVDLAIPLTDGLSAIAAMRQELPGVEVIALMSVLQDALIVGAIRAGAINYLLKDTEAEALRQAIKSAAAGRVQLSPGAMARLSRQPWVPSGVDRLTPRETDLLRLLASEFSNADIAARLVIGENHVRHHVGDVLAKLGVLGRAHAVLCAVRMGLVPGLPAPDR